MKKIVYAFVLMGTMAGVALYLQAMDSDDAVQNYYGDEDNDASYHDGEDDN